MDRGIALAEERSRAARGEFAAVRRQPRPEPLRHDGRFFRRRGAKTVERRIVVPFRQGCRSFVPRRPHPRRCRTDVGPRIGIEDFRFPPLVGKRAGMTKVRPAETGVAAGRGQKQNHDKPTPDRGLHGSHEGANLSERDKSHASLVAQADPLASQAILSAREKRRERMSATRTENR